MANTPTTVNVTKVKGTGAPQVYPLLPTQLLGAQDGSNIGTGGPFAATFEVPNAGALLVNRNIEFLNDRYCLMLDAANASSGVYKKGQGGAGQWGRVQGGAGSGQPSFDGTATGLHVLHPGGVPTLLYLCWAASGFFVVYRTTDGITGANWGGNPGISFGADNAPLAVGQSIVYRDSIFVVHDHQTVGLGAGTVTSYDANLGTVTRYDAVLYQGNSSAASQALHVHNNKLFIFGKTGAGRDGALRRFDGGAFVDIWSAGPSTSITTGSSALFTDRTSGDLILIMNTIGDTTVYRFPSAETAGDFATLGVDHFDITSSVMGATEGANKYLSGGGSQSNSRRWVIFVDTGTTPATPCTFIWTWAPGGNTECWEWIGISSEIEAVSGLAGISDDFALPYNTIGGGHRSPRTGAVELGDTATVPTEAAGGTRIPFRGVGDAAAGTLTFYGGDDEIHPDTVIPIVPGSLVVGAGLLTGLEVYYHMEETASRLDSSGNSLDLTENGTVATGTGIFTLGASFPGTSGNFLFRNNVAALRLGNSLAPFGVSFWVDTNSLASIQNVCSQSNAVTSGWDIAIATDGSIEWIQHAVGTLSSTAADISAGAGLQHVVVTSDGVTTYIYVDGVESTSAASAATVNNSTSQFRVGQRDSAEDRFLNSIVDELAIWSRYLLPSEVAALYNTGSGKLLTDPTGLPTTPTISGNTIINFAPDNGSTLYTVILDTGAAGVDIGEGEVGTIIADF